MKTAKQWMLLCLLPCWLAGLVAGCGRGGAAGALADGVEALQKGRYEKARSRLERAIELAGPDHDMSAAHNLLGMAHYHLKEVEKARKSFEESRRLNPEYAPAAFNLGILLAGLDQMPEAAAQLHDASRLASGDARPLEILAAEYRRLGKWREAQGEILQAASLQPGSPRIMTATAASVIETEGAGAALLYLDAAAKIDANYAPALFNAGLVHGQWLKDRAGALRAYTRFLEAGKSAPETVRAFAGAETKRIRAEIDKEFKATNTTRPPSGTPVSPPPRETTAVPLTPSNPRPPQETPPSDEVARILEQARAAVAERKFDDALNLCLYAAGMASRAGDKAREEKAYRAAVAFCPEQPRAHFALAGFLAGAGRHRDAAPAFLKAAQLAPRWTEAYRRAAASAIETGEYQSALDTLKKAVEDAPASADAQWDLAVVYERHIRLPDSARRAYTKFITAFPRDPRVEQARQALTRLGPGSDPVAPPPPVTPPLRTFTPAPATPAPSAPSRAATPVPPAPATTPPPPAPARGANLAEAIRLYSEAVALQKNEDLDGAITRYQSSIQANPADPRPYYNMGIIYQTRKQLDLARNSYEFALSLNSEMINARYNLGIVYRELGRDADALRELNDVLRRDPRNVSAHLHLGEINEKLGDVGKTREHYRRFLELAPNDPSAADKRRWLLRN